MYNFGVGMLALIPPGSNPTPVQVGTIQEMSILEPEFDVKELYGSKQFPVALGRGKAKLQGKVKMGSINGALVNKILYGSTLTTGSILGAINEVGTVPASSAYVITVANSANFDSDLGVFDVTAGVTLTRVAATPAAGEYSVSAGVYTFNVGAASHVMWLNYSYTATGGKTVALTNQTMGTGLSFVVTAFNTFGSDNIGVKLWAVQLMKLSAPMKNDDFTISDMDWKAGADSSGRVMDVYTSN